MELKVSVVMPVYNAAKYLRRSVESVLSQSLRELELICVDDGSTDESPEILREYAENDIRVRVLLNPENILAGPSRNRGLEAARGQYVLFMDSDDWLLENSLERVFTEAAGKKADVLRCRALDYDNRSGQTSETLHNGLRRVPFFMYGRNYMAKDIFWLLPKLNVAPWGGLFRREFLMENGIRFNDLICVNDRSFYWESMLRAERILLSRERLVCYRTNLGGSLVGSRIKHFDCHFKSYDLVCRMTEACPAKMRRCILNAELLDIAHWYGKAKETALQNSVGEDMSRFVKNIDPTPWAGKMNKSKWKTKIDSLQSN